jgi:hypothetical protein
MTHKTCHNLCQELANHIPCCCLTGQVVLSLSQADPVPLWRLVKGRLKGRRRRRAIPDLFRRVPGRRLARMSEPRPSHRGRSSRNGRGQGGYARGKHERGGRGSGRGGGRGVCSALLGGELKKKAYICDIEQILYRARRNSD